MRTPLPSLLLLLTACTPSVPPLTPPVPAGDELGFDVTCAVSEAIPTVATVVFSVAGGDVEEARVGFGVDGEAGFVAAAVDDGGGGFRAVLVGVPADAEVAYTPEVLVDGTWVAGPEGSYTTGSPPGDLPDATISGDGTGDAAAGFLVSAVVSEPSTAVILDGQGRYVWWHRPPGTWESLSINRAHLTRDGDGVVYLASTTAVGGEAQRALVRVSWDGGAVETVEVPFAHHDFLELPGGGYALLETDTRTVGEQPVQGDRIVELDADGERRELWSVWDHFDYDPIDDPQPGAGWTHANALDLSVDADDPAGGSYTISLRNLDALFTVDRVSGAVLAQIGGDDSDVATADGDTDLYHWQHQFQWLGDDRLLVFDNGGPPWLTSRVVEYGIDLDAGLAEQVWEHTADPPLYSVGYGDVTRLASGPTLITWSTSGQVDEVTADGETVWQLNLALGGGLGYVTWTDALYGEATR